MVSNLKRKKGKEGNAVRYCTRNQVSVHARSSVPGSFFPSHRVPLTMTACPLQALTRLQLKLPEFRRLCILKVRVLTPRLAPRRRT